MSIILAFSKIIEKLLQKQLLALFDNILSNFQWGFQQHEKLLSNDVWALERCLERHFWEKQRISSFANKPVKGIWLHLSWFANC